MQRPDFGTYIHFGLPLIAGLGSGRGYNSEAIRKGHVGDQLLPFDLPLTVDGNNEFSGLHIALVILPVEFGFLKLTPG